MHFMISTHTLTWSVTRDACMVCNANPNFNSHAHVERDQTKTENLELKKNFNSHAHVERDNSQFLTVNTLCISTHTLTWSVTFTFINYYTPFKISTHTLTWSVTQFVSRK